MKNFKERLQEFWKDLNNEEKRIMKGVGIVALCLMIVASFAMRAVVFKANASINERMSDQKPLPKFFTVETIKFDDQRMINGAIDSFEPAIYSMKNGDGPVAAMERIDAIEPLIHRAAEKYGFDSKTQEGDIFTESGARQFALSSADCAGDAQFAVATAREYGLFVSKDWRVYYNRYMKTGSDRDREKLIRNDERFNPEKAIFAQARFLADMQRLYGSPDYAIAAYHMGIGNMRRVINKYRSGWDAPKDLTWTRIVMDSAPYRQPGTHQFLYHELEDSSWSYYFRIRAAMKARALWKSDRVAFMKKVDELNDPLRRSQLVRETVWYPEDRMPQWSTETIRFLTKNDSLSEIKDGEFMNLSMRDVRNPVLTKNTLGALYTIASVMKQETGKEVVVTSATRDYDLQMELVKSGLSPALYSSHLWGAGIDLALYEDEKMNDALSWILNELKWRGDIVWYQEGSHFHVTVAPGTNLVAVAESAQTYYARKIEEDPKVRIAKR